MSFSNSMFGHVPGMGTVIETFEQAYMWGPWPRYWKGAYIGSTASDPTNSPTYELRMGLVMGIIASTGAWVNYSPTATDGSEVAQGVLPIALRMQDVLTGSNTAKYYAVMVSGGLQASKLIGLDGQARAQLSQNFIFDDDLVGRHTFPWIRFQTKTADYTVVSTDNLSLFLTTGASDAVAFTLPTLANGLMFGFKNTVNQNMTVASAAGDDMIVFNDLTADSVAFSTSGEKIGGGVIVFSNPGATAWIVCNYSAGANTITVAT